MSGLIALHGGGEFLPGDERFLRSLIEHASRPGADAEAPPAGSSGPLRIAVVPTAAARGRPDLAAANGVAAFERVASRLGRPVTVRTVRIVDEASATDPDLVGPIGDADLIHFPGGDPDLIPARFAAGAAADALRAAHERGAVIAGASAGAMALAALTWTPGGVVAGLGFVPGVIVAPHADATSWAGYLSRFAALISDDIGVLGLAERTGLIGRPGGPWLVAGEGEVRWLAPSVRDPAMTVVRRDGDELPGPGVAGPT